MVLLPASTASGFWSEIVGSSRCSRHTPFSGKFDLQEQTATLVCAVAYGMGLNSAVQQEELKQILIATAATESGAT